MRSSKLLVFGVSGLHRASFCDLISASRCMALTIPGLMPAMVVTNPGALLNFAPKSQTAEGQLPQRSAVG